MPQLHSARNSSRITVGIARSSGGTLGLFPNSMKPEPNRKTSSTQRRRERGDKLCLRRRRIEQAVTTRGGNSRPVGKPGDRPAPKGHPPRGAKAAPWDTRVSPQVCGIAIREIPSAAVTGQRRENQNRAAGGRRIHAPARVERRGNGARGAMAPLAQARQRDDDLRALALPPRTNVNSAGEPRA